MTKRCPIEYQIAIYSNIYLSKQSRSVIFNWASLLHCSLIQDGISVFRLLSIDSRHFFLILQGHDYCRKAQKDNKKYNCKF